MSEFVQAFSDPMAVAGYAAGAARNVPAYAALQTMTTILVAEGAPENARVLVLGAGGGLELKAFAEAHPGWTFDGIDPAAAMLDLAARTLGPLASTVRLHLGYIDSAPEGPFDAATCLLTLHFIEAEERQRTLAEVRRRLKPGAPFVAAHYSIPSDGGAKPRWLRRYAAFLVASGMDPDHAASSTAAIDAKIHILSPEQDEAIMRDAGFSDVSLFYTGLTFRGWVAYA